MSDQVIPPMPTVSPAVRDETPWWHALYTPTQVLAETDAAPVEEAEVEAEPEPESLRPRSWAGRLPDWRKGETVDLDATAEPEPANPDTATPDTDTPGQDTPLPDPDSPDADPDSPDKPKHTKHTKHPTKTLRGPRALHLTQANSRLRAIAFTSTAAGTGYLLGIAPLLSHALAESEQAATSMVGLLLAAAGARGAWKLVGLPYVAEILPCPPVSRIVLTTSAAELARRLAPAPISWLTAHGTAYGLGPGAVSLLLTAGGMCAGMWWLIDRHARNWWWGARWMARIPFASALLATALYAPGSHA
jgi:hypothetical protein